MLYMLKPGVDERIERFTAAGGTFVATYFSGMVNENDLCCLGGVPGGKLRKVLGIWAEEIDTLYPEESNSVIVKGKSYTAKHFCELIHAEGAETLGSYDSDFYKGMPALTKNEYGKGTAYYIAFCDDGDFTMDFYSELIEELRITGALESKLPRGVTAHTRHGNGKEFLFIENYNDEPAVVELDRTDYVDLLGGGTVSESVELNAYGIKVLELRMEQWT